MTGSLAFSLKGGEAAHFGSKLVNGFGQDNRCYDQPAYTIVLQANAQSFAIVPEFLIKAALVMVAPLVKYEPAAPAAPTAVAYCQLQLSNSVADSSLVWTSTIAS
jgi:hypothetical protein